MNVSTLRNTLVAIAIFAFSTPAMADGILEDPLPRVENQLCPGLVGLDRALAEQIVGRIRANAESVGIALADPATCEPNLLVAFVPDGHAYKADLANRRGYLFRDMDRVDRECPPSAFNRQIGCIK